MKVHLWVSPYYLYLLMFYTNWGFEDTNALIEKHTKEIWYLIDLMQWLKWAHSQPHTTSSDAVYFGWYIEILTLFVVSMYKCINVYCIGEHIANAENFFLMIRRFSEMMPGSINRLKIRQKIFWLDEEKSLSRISK